jgi:superinfection exclusion protein B
MDWLEFYKTLTKPLSFASSLFLLASTSILLFSSARLVERLGMTYVLQNYRWVLGSLFLIGLCWFVIAILLYLGKLVWTQAKALALKRSSRRRLHRLTSDERRILRAYVMSETRTQNWLNVDVATAEGLAEAGILYRPAISIETLRPAEPYCINEWALGYLTTRQHLVAETVSSGQHRENAAAASAVLWLLAKFWGWGPLSFIVGTICIGVGIVLAQEHMYGLARSLVITGAVLVPSKVVHDALVEHKPAKQVLAAFLISGTVVAAVAWGAWWVIDKIEWKNEVIIKVTFKSSPIFTPRRQRKIVWELNRYYRYLAALGFDLSPDIPPLGLTPPHSLLLGGGQMGAPSYYSSIYVPEGMVDDPNIFRYIFSVSFFNGYLTNPNATSRSEAEDGEIAAWVYSCYYPVSFGGRQVCSTEAPGHKWNDALWEIRQTFGADYTDRLLCYSFKMWKAIPSKYPDSFDQFFRYKLVSGESVADNGGGQRYWELNAILQRHGIDITQPQ